MATPDDTLVPLWPLAVILLVAALVAYYMLRLGRRVSVTVPAQTPPSQVPNSP
jgi:hypothetical protein